MKNAFLKMSHLLWLKTTFFNKKYCCSGNAENFLSKQEPNHTSNTPDSLPRISVHRLAFLNNQIFEI